MIGTAGQPGPGVSRQRAIAWLLERCPDVTELQADRMLDYAVSNGAAMVGEYTVTWDPEAGFALWPPGIPKEVIPVGGAEAEAMAGAAGRARLRAGQVISAHGGAGTPAAWAALAAEGTAAVDEAISTYQHSDEPDRDLLDHDQVAWLSVTLGDTRVVRHAWARMDPARQAAHQVLWSDVTRSARPGHVAAPASLLAFTALQGGSEHLAAASLDRALADQPGYPPATLLRGALAAGLPAARYTPATLLLPAPSAASPAKTAGGEPGVPAIRPARADPELEPLSARVAGLHHLTSQACWSR